MRETGPGDGFSLIDDQNLTLLSGKTLILQGCGAEGLDSSDPDPSLDKNTNLAAIIKKNWIRLD